MSGREAPAIATLFEKAQSQAWHLERDLPWVEEIAPGDPLVDPAWAPFGATATFQRLDAPVKALLARRAVEDLLAMLEPGEAVATHTCARLLALVDRHDFRRHLAAQTLEEARHHAAIERLLALLGAGERARLSKPARRVLDDLLGFEEAPALVAGLMFLVEGRGLRIFERLRAAATHPLLAAIAELFQRDEARHVGFGAFYFETTLAGAPVDTRRAVAVAVVRSVLLDATADDAEVDLDRTVRALKAANVTDPWGTAYRMLGEEQALGRARAREQHEGRGVWPGLLAARRAGLLDPEVLEGTPLDRHPLIAGARRAGGDLGGASPASGAAGDAP